MIGDGYVLIHCPFLAFRFFSPQTKLQCLPQPGTQTPNCSRLGMVTPPKCEQAQSPISASLFRALSGENTCFLPWQRIGRGVLNWDPQALVMGPWDHPEIIRMLAVTVDFPRKRGLSFQKILKTVVKTQAHTQAPTEGV